VRALALALLALLALPAGALASDEVRVEPEGASARSFTLSGLGEPDVHERSYTVGGSQVTVTGWSLDRVLRAGRVDPYRFGSLEVAATDGSVTLARSEVTEPDSFPDGPPVFWVEDGQARFLRPAGADGTEAVLAAGGPVTVRVSRQAELAVNVTASTRRTRPGRPVTFTASVSGAGTGEQVEISWYFDDGRSAEGRRVTHRFRRPGSYDVVVGATTSSDEPGADASVRVQVGKPPAGPDRNGGGTNENADAPDSGTAEGGTAGDGAASGADTSSDDSGNGSERDRAQRDRPERSAPDPEERERRSGEPDAPAGHSVSGIELADLSALSSAAGRDALRAARRGRPRDESGPDGPGIPPALWWTLGAGALFGLGGWLEARNAPARPPTVR